jgi:putative DNA primase/helicase
VFASETEEGQRLAESFVKDLTGGDPLSARFLHGEWFDFVPTCKVWLGTNHRPRISGTDLAIWRRIRLIPFNVTVPPEERDPNLSEKLHEELPGILRWAVQGCLDWQRDGLGAPEAVKQANDAYRSESDVLAGFLEECTVRMQTAEVQSGRLYAAYREWTGVNGERAMTGTMFGRKLGERGLDSYRRGGKVYYIGISLQENEA